MPKWGHVYLTSIKHADVRQWVSALARSCSPASVVKVHRVFSQVLAWAVRDARLTSNPAEGVRLPRPAGTDHRYLDHSQVAKLVDRCGSCGLIVRGDPRRANAVRCRCRASWSRSWRAGSTAVPRRPCCSRLRRVGS
ncbi:hypothetical protein [Actinopolyspora biskrensis]|uniref:hypothetical protein n=1 Tax=Actinopolyspora biskrensis TaxID=1470178 RepID=UPI0031B59887